MVRQLGVLKDEDRYLKFVFFTGVTKYSKVSVFSDLNQLKDISLTNTFADICGIMQNEMAAEFQPEICAMAQEQELTEEDCLKKPSITGLTIQIPFLCFISPGTW